MFSFYLAGIVISGFSVTRSIGEANLFAFQSWTLSQERLETATRAPFVVYDKSVSEECIWVAGGLNCETCLYCYNISSNNLWSYDNLNIGGHLYAHESAHIIDGKMYFLQQSGSIQTYDFETKTESTLYTNISGVNAGSCFAKHPNNSQFYMLGTSKPVATNQFIIFDVNSNTSYNSTKTLNHGRRYPSCIVNNYNDENNAYLYVFGGDPEYIERINVDYLNFGSEWQVLSQTFASIDISSSIWSYSGVLRHTSPINYYNYIILMTHYVAWTSDYEHTILALDVSTLSLEYVGIFPEEATCCTGTVLINNEQIFAFGGHIEGDYTSDIYYSAANLYIESDVPTRQPTLLPTRTLTATPTNNPTTDPTVATTNEPSLMASSKPSSLPTNVATNMPSSTDMKTTMSSDDNVNTHELETTSATTKNKVQKIETTGSAGIESNVSNSGKMSDSVIITIIICAALLVCCCLVVFGVIIGMKYFGTIHLKEKKEMEKEMELQHLQRELKNMQQQSKQQQLLMRQLSSTMQSVPGVIDANKTNTGVKKGEMESVVMNDINEKSARDMNEVDELDNDILYVDMSGNGSKKNENETKTINIDSGQNGRLTNEMLGKVTVEGEGN